MAYAYANQGTLMHELEGIEGQEIRMIDFGPFKMMKNGNFGSDNGFRAIVNDTCWLAIAEACKIPKGFLKDIPPELRAINVNYRLSQLGVRHKYGMVICGDDVISLLPKGYDICSNTRLLDILTSVFDGKQMFIDWHLGLMETYLYMVMPRESFPYKGPEHIQLGMAVCHSAITGSDTRLHRLLYDKKKELIVVYPSKRVMDTVSYKMSIEALHDSTLFDAESIIGDYTEACKLVIKETYKFAQNLGKEAEVTKTVQRDLMTHTLKSGGLHFLVDFVRHVALMGEKNADKPGQKFTCRTMGGHILNTGRFVISRLTHGS